MCQFIGTSLHFGCKWQCNKTIETNGKYISNCFVHQTIQPSSTSVCNIKYYELLNFCFSDWDPQIPEEEALKQFERCQRQEQTFGDLFTGTFDKIL